MGKNEKMWNNEISLSAELEKDDFVMDLQKQIMMDIPHTNKYWAENIAISLLSSVSGNLEYNTKIGKVPMNTWFMAIAESSRGYKSPPLNYFMREILKIMERDSGNYNWKLLFPSSFSTEGLVEFMAKTSTRGVIINDEMSSLFKATQGKGYTVSLMEFLDKLFDGIVEPRYTRQYKLEEVPDGAYVSLIGATTPMIYHTLDYDTFISGFGMRFLYELWEPSKEIEFNNENLFGENEDRKIILDKYAKQLANIYQLNQINTKMSDEAKIKIVKYRNNLEKLASDMEVARQNHIANYVTKISIYLFKFPSLFALSRNINNIDELKITDENNKKNITIQIEKQDVERAYEKILRHIENFKKVLAKWNLDKNKKSVPVMDFTGIYDSIVANIQNSKGQMMRRDNIAVAIGMLNNNSPTQEGHLKLQQKDINIFNEAESLGKIRKLTNDELKQIPTELFQKIDVSILDKNKERLKNPPTIYVLPDFNVEKFIKTMSDSYKEIVMKK